MSLENARAYEELQKERDLLEIKVQERTRDLEHLFRRDVLESDFSDLLVLKRLRILDPRNHVANGSQFGPGLRDHDLSRRSEHHHGPLGTDNLANLGLGLLGRHFG